MILEGFCSPVFPSGIAEPGPALVVVALWVLCVFLDSVVFFPFFEADNFQQIPKLTADFGIILVKGQKSRRNGTSFPVWEIRTEHPWAHLSFIVAVSVKPDSADCRTGRFSLIRSCCCGSRFFQLHELLAVSLHWLKS